MRAKTDEEKQLMERLTRQGIVNVSNLSAEDARILLSMMINDGRIGADELRNALHDTADYVCKILSEQAEHERQQRKRELKQVIVATALTLIAYLLGRLATMMFFG